MHTPDMDTMPLLSPGCRVAADSCSLILLNRLQLLEIYADVHTLVVTQHVYAEITGVRGADKNEREHALYQKLFASRLYTARISHTHGLQTSTALSEADRSLINAYYMLGLNGILTDDGTLCRCCRMAGIPYINAPMALFVLLHNRILTDAHYSSALEKLYTIGRYGKFVHDYMQALYQQQCAQTALQKQLDD
jgi:rRNA-processing protein FCF1